MRVLDPLNKGSKFMNFLRCGSNGDCRTAYALNVLAHLNGILERFVHKLFQPSLTHDFTSVVFTVSQNLSLLDPQGGVVAYQ